MSQQDSTSNTPLSDVMIAMDVVDTLRHDKKIVERELNDDKRRKELIDRLREIYRGQGIEVPDHILEEGVKALEEDRFTYTPPSPDHLSTRLAKLYVTRWHWGRYVLGGLAAIITFYAVNYFVFERPRVQKTLAERHELDHRLPESLQKLATDIKSETEDDEVEKKAEALKTSGLNAASSRNLKSARKSEQELKYILQTLRQDYDIRIVNRKGEVSGLWRIPDKNPDTYNFYLVVEALTKSGERLPQWITNEETGKREKVKIWAVRVDRSVLEAVKADKDDDGIIQKAVVGHKNRGELEPRWNIPVSGGAITNWK